MERRESEDGMGPENELSATERFWRFRRKATSGERVPVRFWPEISRETTNRRRVELEEEQETPAQVQWSVLEFHEEREFCGSSEMADLIPNKALYSGKTLPWMR